MVLTASRVGFSADVRERTTTSPMSLLHGGVWHQVELGCAASTAVWTVGVDRPESRIVAREAHDPRDPGDRRIREPLGHEHRPDGNARDQVARSHDRW